nr:DNA-binding protein [Oceanococcus sp. HetDA_MAG_MS8]
MAQLIVRNLEDEVVRALKISAAEHGRSAEEEHRELLRSVLLRSHKDKNDFKSLLAGIPSGDDEIFERPRDTGRDVAL